MKTIATAAVLMMVTVPAWAGEPQNTQANDPANTGEPIVLSEVEMDGVTAGFFPPVQDFVGWSDTSSSTYDGYQFTFTNERLWRK